MNAISVPKSLRSTVISVSCDENPDFDVSLKFTVACLVAAGSITGAEAQESPLPPVTIDAPVARPRPPAAKPTPEQFRVRTAVRRIAREQPKRAQPAPASSPNATPSAASLPADRDPYANPAAPLMNPLIFR
jgi:catecholate siderophore receptor